MLQLAVRHAMPGFNLNISLDMGQEVLALFGPSGAGKSISLHMVAGLVRPAAGCITLNGRTLFNHQQGINLPPQQRRVGLVMQDYTLFPHLSVGENIAFGLRRRGLSGAQTRQAVAEMLALVKLPDTAGRRPQQLSGGQQQRVALARALVTRPDILLLDEPFSALDAPTRAQLRLDLRELLAQLGVPALLVTHDLAEAALLARRIAVVQRGQVLQVDEPARVLHQPATAEVARITGVDNIFEGVVERSAPDGVRVRVGPLWLDAPAGAFVAGQAVVCCLRPEQVLLLRPGADATAYGNVVSARLEAVLTDGFSFGLRLRLVADRLTPERPYDIAVTLPLHVYESLRPAAGQVWRVSLKPQAIHLISKG